MPQFQFVFRGWDFPVAALHGQVQFLVLLPCPSLCNDWRRGAVSSGSSGCFFLAVERRQGGGAAGGFVCLLAGIMGLITQVMSPCKLVSVTVVHRHVVVDIRALVVNPLTETTTTTTLIVQSGEAPF